MGDYFKPWRRKIGVLTLAMACVLMAAWARSLTIADSAGYAHPGAGYWVASVDGRFELWIDRDAKFDIPMWVRSQPIEVRRARDERCLKRNEAAKRRLEAVQELRASVTAAQFAVWESRSKETVRQTEKYIYPFCRIPYWPVVVPLTLFSAWLLLSKPRKIEAKRMRPNG